MTDIVLIGHGKMGRAIEELVHTEYRDRFRILNIVEKPPLEAEALQGCDAVIEFTEPGSAYGNIRFCIDHGIPCVSGTTGWTEKLRELQLYAVEKDGSFLYAPNFSIGVNLFFETNRFLAELMDRPCCLRCADRRDPPHRKEGCAQRYRPVRRPRSATAHS